MGFTHYWNIGKAAETTDFNEVRNMFHNAYIEVLACYHELPDHVGTETGRGQKEPLVICGGLGVGKPIINESTIWFNGDESTGNDHETFSINLFLLKEDFYFCKTALKPYDFFVRLVLLAFAKNFPRNMFKFSSDGNLEGWMPAIKFYEKVTKRRVNKYLLNSL
jgi:hypothetical protein